MVHLKKNIYIKLCLNSAKTIPLWVPICLELKNVNDHKIKNKSDYFENYRVYNLHVCMKNSYM